MVDISQLYLITSLLNIPKIFPGGGSGSGLGLRLKFKSISTIYNRPRSVLNSPRGRVGFVGWVGYMFRYFRYCMEGRLPLARNDGCCYCHCCYCCYYYRSGRGGEDCEGHQEAPKRLEVLCGDNGALRRQAFRGESHEMT